MDVPVAPQADDIIGRLDALLAQEKEPPPAPAEAVPEEPAPVEKEAAPNKQVEGGEAAQGVAAQELSLDDVEAIELEVTTKGEDGKDVAEKLSVKALRDGYMKDADYRRKTADLARQREQLSNETHKAVTAERAQYVTDLQKMHDLVLETAAAELKGVDWNHLAQNDAFEYVRLDNRKKQIAQALETIQSKQKEVIAKHQAEQKAAMHEAAGKARTQLEAEIPGWNDTLYQGLLKTGVEKFGFKPEEVSNWIDPRMIKLLHAASDGVKAQDQAKVETPAPAKRVVVTPRSVKPGAATVIQAQASHAAAMKKLQDSGKISDAAEVIRQRLG